MRTACHTLIFIILIGWGAGASAQTTSEPAPDATSHVDATPPAQSSGGGTQAGDVAAGESGTKPTRGFFSALGHNLVDDAKHIPRWNSAYWLAGGIGLAYAVHPIDHTLNAHLVTHPNVFAPGSIIGSLPVIMGAGFAAYVFGRVDDFHRTEHLGMDEIEGALLSEGVVELSKEVIRRPRPSMPTGTLSSGFSMPSGHSTMTFAAATILQQHLGYKAGVPTYLIATYVAMSRLHDNVHYASDVVMGAATGIIIGRSVTWHGRNFYGELQPVPGGAAVTFATR